MDLESWNFEDGHDNNSHDPRRLTLPFQCLDKHTEGIQTQVDEGE